MDEDGKVRRRSPKNVDKGRVVGPERDEADEYEPNRKPIDRDNPVGPIRNLTGVVGGAAAAASSNNLRTPPTNKELRERKKAKRKRERQRKKRRKKREKQRKKNQKKRE